MKFNKTVYFLFGVAIIFFNLIFGVLIYSYAFSKKSGRDVYLYANNKQELNSKNFDKGSNSGASLNAFFASPYENMSLYKPHNFSNDIKSSYFYGNLNNYNYINNSNSQLNIWQDDFTSEQLVIKTGNSTFDEGSLKAKITSVNYQNDNIRVIYGFNRYIYASYNPSVPLIDDVNQKLLVPDAITNSHIVNVTSNNVYILWIKFLTTGVVKPDTYKYKVNLFLNEKLLSLPKKYTINLKVSVNKVTKKWNSSSFNIYSFFGWTAGYYDGNTVPTTVKNPSDEREYFNYNWSKYWEPESLYLHNIYGMDYFQMPISLSAVPDPSFENNWVAVGSKKVKSFIHWQAKNTYDLKNHHYFISDSDWNVFDLYVEKMAEIGFDKVFLTGWQYGWSDPDTKSTFVWNDETKKYVRVEMKIDTLEGKINNQWIFNQVVNHIKEKRKFDPKIWNNLNFYLYTDELPDSSLQGYSNLFSSNQSINPSKQFLKFAICDWDRDLNYNDINLQTVDILYVHFLDFYNEDNVNFERLLNERNKRSLITGQYSLDSDYTFNLIRAEPGVLDYIMLAMYKEGMPNFMRYILQGWDNGKSYWNSDYDEAGGLKYVSGDTILAYPFANVKLGQKDFKPKSGKKYDMNNYGRFNPSVRLENLALGTNMVNKIKFLVNNGKISNQELKTIFSYISKVTKQSKISSHTKFNFNFDNTSLKFDNSFSHSFVNRFFSDSNIDEITVVKVVNNIINSLSN